MDEIKKQRGIFVTLDGVDGTGKSTTCTLLAAKLNAVVLSSPLEPFRSQAHLVKQTIQPLISYSFYRTATAHDSKQIEQLLLAGQNVVCDRYIYSTYAYHVAMDPVIETIFDKDNIIEPDLAVLLHASSAVRQARLQTRKQVDPKYNSLLENDAAYQNRVQGFFQTMNMFEVDTGEYGSEKVVKMIIDRLRCRLGID